MSTYESYELYIGILFVLISFIFAYLFGYRSILKSSSSLIPSIIDETAINRKNKIGGMGITLIMIIVLQEILSMLLFSLLLCCLLLSLLIWFIKEKISIKRLTKSDIFARRPSRLNR